MARDSFPTAGRIGRDERVGRRRVAAVTARDDVTDEQYRQLLELRTGLRRFLAWSEAQAKAAGMTPAQHQLLLAVRGHPGGQPPTVGEVAEYLLLKPHSAGELVVRAADAGLVERVPDATDARVVRVRLTDDGARRLAALSAAHHEELARLAPRLRPLWDGLGPTS